MAHTSIASRMYHDLGAMLAPVLTSTRFVDDGVLTPEEFVAAGDALIRISPLWQWQAGEEASRQSFLPDDKQYLLLKGVPCSQRVSALEDRFRRAGAAEATDADGWVSAETGGPASEAGSEEGGAVLLGGDGGLASLVREDYGGDAPGAAAAAAVGGGGAAASAGAEDAPGTDSAAGGGGEDEYLDLDDFGGEEADEATATEAAAAPPAALGASDSAGFERTRTYDVSMVYDRKYRTPRVFLSGYDEDSVPLSPEHVMEDVVSDYANRTVTVEPHFHEPGKPVQASIHPCRHAAAMKRIVASLLDAGMTREDVAGRVELYLLYFLKFVQSVIPTIEYDSTVDVEVRKSPA